MHGYEIIRTLGERSHGCWRPSAGSVYPILQLLTDQGFVTVSDEDGKKIYAITPAGREHAAKEKPAMPWEHDGSHFSYQHIQHILPQIHGLKQSIKKIMIAGTPADIDAVTAIIKQASVEIETIAKKLDTND